MNSATKVFPKLAVRRLFKVINGATPDSHNLAFWNGSIAWVTPEDLSKRESFEIEDSNRTITESGYASCGTSLVPPGAIVLSTRAPIGNLAIAAKQLCTNQGCKSLIPIGDLNSRYFYYQLSVLSGELNRLGKGTTFLELSTSELSGFKLSSPRLADQERIANFLDDKTTRIDALIAEKEQLVKRLMEFAQSSISARILGQDLLGPTVTTHVPEIGAIPNGWVLSPMMRLTDPARPIMYGIVLPGPNVEQGPSVPIVKGGDVRPHRLKLALLNRTTPELEAPFARARLAEGDIIYSIRGTIGDVELVPKELVGANITQDVARIAPRAGVHGRWLLYAAKSRPVFAQLDQLSLGAAVRGINIFDLKRACVPTPPLELQVSIANELDQLTGKTTELCSHSLEHIARLREYRSSLISAAVTGELDVGSFKVTA